MEREAVLVGIDAGTTKVTTLIGEVARSGDVSIIGYGIGPSVGMKKGMVANIDQTVNSLGGEPGEGRAPVRVQDQLSLRGGRREPHQQPEQPRRGRGLGPRREVSREDVARATEAAKAVQVPTNREMLHVIPRGYIVDGQEGIKDPLGMSAVRLEVETHIVAGAATSVQNLTKCVTSANVQIDELVISSLAAAEATLTDTEKELGVLVADIGGGTTDIAIFIDGAVYHTAVLPVGRDQRHQRRRHRAAHDAQTWPRRSRSSTALPISPTSVPRSCSTWPCSARAAARPSSAASWRRSSRRA